MAQRSVLLVSDNVNVLDGLRYAFPDEMEVESVRDARDAIEHLRRAIPDAVVVDLQTGSAGGFGLARDIAADLRLREIPVVILIDRPQDAWLARQAGARFYRVKPVDGGDLAADVVALMTPEPEPVT